jgi:lipopolysaccharide/colanic/teichoic acid biosynthesis glycosyltransferase
MVNEPERAFPYSAPSVVLRTEYDQLLDDAGPYAERVCKRVFDFVLSLALSICLLPLFLAICAAQMLAGFVRPDQGGPIIISYDAVSRGRVFKKYKFRTMRTDAIDPVAASKRQWRAYAAEWNYEDLTKVGRLLKATYLDELPQLLNIIVGDMSMVGPRPLACHHYERDVAQGNVFRRHLKAGLFGPSQALKGSAQFGKPDPEFEYLALLRDGSPLAVVRNDMRLIVDGIKVVLRVEGL